MIREVYCTSSSNLHCERTVLCSMSTPPKPLNASMHYFKSSKGEYK